MIDNHFIQISPSPRKEIVSNFTTHTGTSYIHEHTQQTISHLIYEDEFHDLLKHIRGTNQPFLYQNGIFCIRGMKKKLWLGPIYQYII